MRLPNYSDLSEEQDKVYLDAPMDGDILVTGPPGTGKTVIAFYRARTLANKGEQEITVLMYNRVLNRYVNLDSDESYIVNTMFSWLQHWWNKAGNPSDESTVERYNLNCPFSQKNEAKRLGARWDPFKKTWYVDADIFHASSGKFTKWAPEPISTFMPSVGNDEFEKDWEKVADLVEKGIQKGAIKLNSLSWGHLIIDEAQDFSNGLYELFFQLKLLFKSGKSKKIPSLTIFADENQRLQEKHNSTIKEIREALFIPKNREYSLTRNYRNTRQIAMLASYFYTGLQTGKPDLPDRDGELPVLLECASLDKSVDFIVRFATNHDDEEIGIIVPDNRIRKKYFNKVQHRIKDNKYLKIQTYANKDKDHNTVDELSFDQEGVISIFNKHSCKGLEFDTVFIPELQKYSVGPNEKDQFMMDMYVMVSRARSQVFLTYTKESDSSPNVLKNLPDKSDGLLELRYEK